MAYVTGAAILAHVRETAPNADQSAWADKCAAAVEGLIADRMAGVIVAPLGNALAELTRAALDDGAAAYARRNAPHGILSMGPDGEAVRLGADIALALRPVFRRYGTPGIG